eukprot:GILK01012547.1.p1 GENE.GILK01012547.1~~GILK01012547.1.p1  ORF type:complete len:167 (-),score=1.58 GILK01012547.1:40-540(-)
MECRICQVSEPENLLFSPCECKGTMRNVHKTCLSYWLRQCLRTKTAPLGELRCELCGYKFRTELRSPTLLDLLFSWKACWRDSLKYIFHFMYIGFVVKRVWTQTKVMLASFPRRRKPVWGVDMKILLFLLMLSHYGVFLMVDIKYLCRQFSSWRLKHSSLIVYEKN